ncbi:MAG: metallophosphatase family protein [Actinomycetota bacterium]|nr:metallophosphatase family protein [Actinomycetota bacterium]
MGPLPQRATRIAALYDIHANLPALEAVLDDLERADIDVVVVGGDIAWGPFPRATIERLRELRLPTIYIRGNADREVGGRAGEDEGLDPVVAAVNRWCADQLAPQDLGWLLELDESAVLDIAGLGATRFCHGSPRSDEEILTTQSPASRVRDALAGVDERVVVCGHSHMQFDLTAHGHRLVNAGSVGMPYEGRPGAYWALLGPDVELKRTEYDIAAAGNRISGSGCPYATEVFRELLDDPPSPDEVARHFEKTAASREK